MSARDLDAVLVANRGEIACRIIAHAAAALGMRDGRGVLRRRPRRRRTCAWPTRRCGSVPAPARESYLRGDAIVGGRARDRARTASTPATASCPRTRRSPARSRPPVSRFLGPDAARSSSCSATSTPRASSPGAPGVPLLAGTGLLADAGRGGRGGRARSGYPVMLKATAGGGGIGMAVCRDADELADGVRARARAWPTRASASGGVFLERFVARRPPRRGAGLRRRRRAGRRASATATARCSAATRRSSRRRRRPACPTRVRAQHRTTRAARSAPSRSAYRSAGTVEFLFDAEREEARVPRGEHPAAGRAPRHRGGLRHRPGRAGCCAWPVGDTRRCSTSRRSRRRGHADRGAGLRRGPGPRHRPSAGLLTEVALPGRTCASTPGSTTGHRGHAALRPAARQGHRARAPTARGGARAAGRRAREHPRRTASRPTSGCCGPRSRDRRVRAGAARRPARSRRSADAARRGSRCARRARDDGAGPARPGSATGHVGRPAERADGRPVVPARQPRARQPRGRRRPGVHAGRADAAVHVGRARLPDRAPTCRSRSTATPVPLWEPVAVAGRRRCWTSAPPPARACAPTCSSRGGLDVPGTSAARRPSRSAASAATAVARCAPATSCARPAGCRATAACRVRPGRAPASCRRAGSSASLEGPHAAPEFFTADDIDTFYGTDWEVHYNSARTGVRLVGPQPALGAPRRRRGRACTRRTSTTRLRRRRRRLHRRHADLLGPDGPSLGGFVCPAVVATDERWKLGQLRPGDTVRFVPSPAGGRARDRAAPVRRGALATAGLARPTAATGA